MLTTVVGLFLLVGSPPSVDMTGDIGGQSTNQGGLLPRAETNTFFVNMEGVTLQGGVDDATIDSTKFPECGVTWQAWGDDSARAGLMQAVVADWEPFGVSVTDSRPASAPYIMTVVSPLTNGCAPSYAAGYAPQDCGGNPSDVVFAFPNAGGGIDGNLLAAVVGQEIGHAISLAHVSGAADILNPVLSGDPTFADVCLPMSGLKCSATPGCGSNEQNSYQFLMSTYGPGTPDSSPPVVEIIAPMDGDTFEAGASFMINVEATDDRALDRMELYNGSELVASVAPGPGFAANMVPAGEYAFMVVVFDIAGNEGSSDVVRVSVGEGGPPPPGEDGNDDGAGDDGHDDGGSDDGEDDATGAWPDLDEGARGDGCGCRVTPDAGLLLLWAIVPLMRRRRT